MWVKVYWFPRHSSRGWIGNEVTTTWTNSLTCHGIVPVSGSLYSATVPAPCLLPLMFMLYLCYSVFAIGYAISNFLQFGLLLARMTSFGWPHLIILSLLVSKHLLSAFYTKLGPRVDQLRWLFHLCSCHLHALGAICALIKNNCLACVLILSLFSLRVIEFQPVSCKFPFFFPFVGIG